MNTKIGNNIFRYDIGGDSSTGGGKFLVSNESQTVFTLVTFNSFISPLYNSPISLEEKKKIIRKRINTRFKKAWDTLAEL